MDASPMLSAVVQATILHIIGVIVSSRFSAGAYDEVWEDPVFRDYWAVMGNLTTPLPAGQNATAAAAAAAAAAATATSTNNSTAMALLNPTSTNSSSNSSSFYTTPDHPGPEQWSWWYIPNRILTTLLMNALLYLWAVGLERAFPTRPRGDLSAVPKREKVVVELSEEHEEEVVKQWIARGRVRRSSISWCNTLIKWLLDVTVRATLEVLLWGLLVHLLDGKVWDTPGEFWGDVIQMGVGSWIAFWITGGPLISLVSLVIVPAPKRIVFENALNLASSVFFHWFLSKAAAWVIKQDVVQEFLRSSIEAAKDMEQHKRWAEKGRLLDELTYLHPDIVRRLKAPGGAAAYLDIGCCFGQDLRRLVLDGVPSEHLVGLDNAGPLMELGKDLFLDGATLRSRFVVADVFRGPGQGTAWTRLLSDPPARAAAGGGGGGSGFDVVHCSAFFHLFPLPDQIAAAKQIAPLVKQGGLLVGRQIGSVRPGDVPAIDEGSVSFRHDVESLAAMWDEVGAATGTGWEVTGDMDMVGVNPDSPVENADSRRLLFTITRVR
ncbi:hypothetical protein PG991_003050 [Apiospora marii]|uniref:Methyltransferase domain-containing protein n=1 Tax=Apiospora marii TaxID=335849 RepID=A0ABR1SHK2_9PEZI